MKNFKILFILILATFLMLGTSGCLKQPVVNRPVDQPLTKWRSIDGTIYFETDENGAGFGTLTVNGNTIDIYFATGAGKAIEIYVMENGVQKQLVERWYGSFIRKDKFTAKVLKTTFYEEGDKFTFYRIDTETKSKTD